jgi:hypothetical protein
METVPQGLKPAAILRIHGTSKLVPFQNSFEPTFATTSNRFATGCAGSAMDAVKSA